MNYINGLHFNNIRVDIYGGLTTADVVPSLAMAMVRWHALSAGYEIISHDP